MKKTAIILLAVALILGAVSINLVSASGKKPGVLAVEVVELRGTVTKVDLKAKKVAIKGDGGKTVMLDAKHARNLEQVKAGDRVIVELIESLALFVTKPGSGPAADAAQVVKLAPKGQKPAGIVANVVELKAQVVAIDYKARTVSLKGPAGQVRTLKFGPEAKNFDKVKKGDEVVLRHTEAVAIAVKKP